MRLPLSRRAPCNHSGPPHREYPSADSNRERPGSEPGGSANWPRRASSGSALPLSYRAPSGAQAGFEPAAFPSSGYRGSNPGPSPRQGDALPLSYIRMEPARRIELRLHPYQGCVLPLSLGRHRSGSWTRTSVHAGQSRVGMPANPPRIVEPSPGADPGVPAIQRATRAPARKALPPVQDSTPSFRARIRTLTYVTQNHASCQLDHPELVIR
jgi:hypothetical protein